MNLAPLKLRFRDSQIEMAHGAGGKASRRLVEAEELLKSSAPPILLAPRKIELAISLPAITNWELCFPILRSTICFSLPVPRRFWL